MPTNPLGNSLTLPERPNLRHLKDQAKDLFKRGEAESLTNAQFKIARMYGFASWQKLREHVESFEEIGQLKQAIDANDLEHVKILMTGNPALHRAPIGYNKNGPLTWVAECRIPWEAPGPVRMAMAQWMIDHGSDVHQGGDGPLMRAALMGHRIPMMELLVANGADVNAEWNGYYPIVFAPCETLEPESLRWLLARGAKPNVGREGRKYPGTALDQVIAGYARSANLAACMELLMDAGGATKYDSAPLIDLLRGRMDRLLGYIEADPGLVHQKFPEFDFGITGARRLTLRGTTLLHVAAEYGNVEAAALLLDRGADVNARATVEGGVGGQTPVFHSATQYGDWGLEATRLLLDRGADLSLRVKLPGHYERPDGLVECNAVEYAEMFPGGERETVELVRRASRG